MVKQVLKSYGFMMCNVDIMERVTASGDVSVHPVDGPGVKVSAG